MIKPAVRRMLGIVGQTGVWLLTALVAMGLWDAALLSVIMLGAFWTVTTKEADLSAVDPMVTAIVLLIVLAARWPRRYRFARDAKA